MIKPPRVYAFDILIAKGRDAKREVYESVPEHFKALVRAHVNQAIARRKGASKTYVKHYDAPLPDFKKSKASRMTDVRKALNKDA